MRRQFCWDTASVLRVNELVIAKIGFEYSEITFDPPYDAPYDLKLEIHGYNCETLHDNVIAGLDITPEGYVSDSLTGKAAQRRADTFVNTPATTAAFKQLCAMSTPAAFKGEGGVCSVNEEKKRLHPPWPKSARLHQQFTAMDDPVPAARRYRVLNLCSYRAATQLTSHFVITMR